MAPDPWDERDVRVVQYGEDPQLSSVAGEKNSLRCKNVLEFRSGVRDGSYPPTRDSQKHVYKNAYAGYLDGRKERWV